MAEANGIDIGRDKRGKFVPGHRSIGGRPLGSRNKLAEKFLADLQRQWQKSGKKALERTAEADPVAFCKIVASLLPKELDATLSIGVDATLTVEAKNFAEAYKRWGSFIGANPSALIEARAVENGENTEAENDHDAPAPAE